MKIIADILGGIMLFCYNFLNNYGVAIIIFTLISKIILLPISIYVQKNSIKMVKMTPDLNKIKIKFFGDRDRIDEETTKLYKKEKYNPLMSIIPLIIQIVLLLGVVDVINHPLTYILDMNEKDINKYVELAIDKNKLEEDSSSLELAVVNDIKKNRHIDDYKKIASKKEIKEIKNIKLNFLGFDLSWVASRDKGITYLVPLIAGLSALILCFGQNKMNVLQAEQSSLNKNGMLIFSVGLSLYLGTFVPAGVALYWTCSNIFAVIQQWLLNIFINPKKYVDYEEMEKTRKELNELTNLDKKKKKRTKEQIKKEKEDYKKFFSIVNKHLVFYSEENGFYKYYKGIIEYILKNTNIVIHYITSDYNDKIFELEKKEKNIRAYYIEEKKLITLMMKMDADVVVMTMPDLENFHIKRSYIRDDIKYIYIPHGMDSLNMTMRNKSMNHYDAVLCSGKHQYDEMIETNEVYGLKDREIVKWGYTLFDDMVEAYEKENKNKKPAKNKQKTILIAPSWQKDNIIDLCLEEVLDSYKKTDYKIIVRPHPQHVRHQKEKFEELKNKYKENKNIEIQTDFSSNSTVFNADLVVTDWSSIAHDFSFTTKKPSIFIDTPMKIMNPDYKEIKVDPINIWSRDVIGKVIKVKDVSKIAKETEKMLKDQDKYYDKITKFVNEYVYNIGHSDQVGGDYIINEVVKQIEKRKKEEKNEKNK